MTSGLRKAHKYIWLLLVIVVPTLIVFAIKNLEFFPSENNAAATFSASKDTALTSKENAIIKVSVFENSIEIILKTTLKSASSIVYSLDANGNKSKSIGQLTTAGIYTFKTDAMPKGILIIDELKNIELTKLTL